MAIDPPQGKRPTAASFRLLCVDVPLSQRLSRLQGALWPKRVRASPPSVRH